tara:strand:+ start:5181 stop:8099 length:2919 start_codon:yes stop_codon:yes gene_type:complete
LGLGRSAETVRGMVRGIKDMPQAGVFFDSARRGGSAKNMTPRRYYDTFLSAPSTDLAADAASFGFRRPPPSDAVIRQIMKRDTQAYNALANAFTYRDAKGVLHFDSQGMWRSVSQDPTGVLAALATGGEGFLVKGSGIVGKIARTSEKGSRAASIAKATKVATEAAAKTANAAKWVLNPFTPAFVAVARSTPVRAGITSAVNTIVGKKSIYTPEFTKEWTPFKTSAEDRLRTNGMSDDMIKSPETQYRIYDMFQQQTGGKFSNPFTKPTADAMRKNGMNPANYGPPHIGKIIEDTVNVKGGITPAIINEGRIRAAGANDVTRSAATGESPGVFFNRQEGPARTQSEEQISDALSGKFAPPEGMRPPTYQDVANDFINTQVERRNAFGQSYSAAARNDGVYSDPNAFAARLNQEADAMLRQRGITPSELQTNDKFGAANGVVDALRRNINSHGASVPSIEEVVQGTRYKLGDRDIWFDENGNPAQNAIQRVLNADPVIQAKINAPRPQPVNRLSLEALEIERRSLNIAAENAYQKGVKSGDFRNYNAITAYRDALDNTSINMGESFTGDANAAIRQLEQGRAQYQEWRSTGVDSQNPVVRDAAGRVMARTKTDPSTGTYKFIEDPGGRSAVGDAFKGKIVGNDNVAPDAISGSGATVTNPAETYTALSKSLSPTGQKALQGHIRTEGYGRPGASLESLLELDRVYGNEGIDLLTPQERNYFNISNEGRAATSPSGVPPQDPFRFNPINELNKGQSPLSKAAAMVAPVVKGGIGYGVGTAIGGPGLGYTVSGLTALEAPLTRAATEAGKFTTAQSGAPLFSYNIPNIEIPLSAGMAAGSQYAINQGREQQRINDDEASRNFRLQPSTRAQLPVAGPSERRPMEDGDQDDTAAADSAFVKQLEAVDENVGEPGMYRGGRTAYKAGGKVGSIEPLVQALMSKAKRAKKVSNKATEPLLNEHDNSIARALAVAQKSI